MSVPISKRTQGRLEVDVLALDLCEYTLHITANPANFPESQISFIEKIRNAALDIHLLCWEANNIRVGDSQERYTRRMALQNQAIDQCNRLCALIEISKKLFHMSTKRTVYWMDKVTNLRATITSWHNSDKKRLRGL